MLAWRAMQRPGFEADRFHVVLLDLKTGERRALTQDWDRSVDQIAFSPDGRTLYAVADHFGQRPVWAIDVKTGKPTMLTGPGHVDSFAVGEREIVFAVSSLKSPAELYALTLRGGDLRELPRMNGDAFAAAQIGEPEQFTFAGANDETVYGYVMRPANFDARRRYPVAFIVHGGPQIVLCQCLELSLESADVCGRRLRVDLHRLPRLARLRPSVHRCGQQRLGRQAARGPAERTEGSAREVSVARRRAHVRARRFVRRLHDELDRRQLERAVQVPRQPRRHLRHARHGLHDRRAVVQRVGERRHALGGAGRTTRNTTRKATSRTGASRCW